MTRSGAAGDGFESLAAAGIHCYLVKAGLLRIDDSVFAEQAVANSNVAVVG